MWLDVEPPTDIFVSTFSSTVACLVFVSVNVRSYKSRHISCGMLGFDNEFMMRSTQMPTSTKITVWEEDSDCMDIFNRCLENYHSPTEISMADFFLLEFQCFGFVTGCVISIP